MKKTFISAVLFTIIFSSFYTLANTSFAETVPFTFTRNFKLGMTGNDVKELQKYLNANGFSLALNGIGSKGKETAYFGELTKKALIKFQEKNRLEILDSQGLKSGTGILQSFTREFINKLLAKINVLIVTTNSTISFPLITASSTNTENTVGTSTATSSSDNILITRRSGRANKTNVSAPSAPTEATKTSMSITLVANPLHEFSIDLGTNWQNSEIFTGLTPSTQYFFVARIKEATTTNASPASASTSITTSPEMIASFTANPTSGGAPLTVYFTNNTSGYTSDNPITWLWEFGNGDTSTASNPGYDYNTLGSFVARLTATNLDGTSTATQNIQVGPLDDASFYYPSATFCQSGSNRTPTITGLAGGNFTSSPLGLSLNPSTGTINFSTSVLGSYSVIYTTNGISPNSQSIPIVIFDTNHSAHFNYATSTFAQGESNPLPIFTLEGSAGIFTAPAGLVFAHVNTGEINLASSTPDTYIVTNTIPLSGSCSSAVGTTTVIITS